MLYKLHMFLNIFYPESDLLQSKLVPTAKMYKRFRCVNGILFFHFMRNISLDTSLLKGA